MGEAGGAVFARWEEAHVTGNLTIAYPRSTSRRRKQHGRTGNHSSTSEQRGQATWKNRNHVSPRKPIQHSKVASTAPRAEGHAEAEHAYRAPCHLERVASSSVSSSPFRFPDSQCAHRESLFRHTNRQACSICHGDFCRWLIKLIADVVECIDGRHNRKEEEDLSAKLQLRMGGVRRSRKHTSEAPRIEPYINIDAEESSSGLHSLGPWRLWGSADTPGRRPPFRFRRCGGRGGVVSDAEHCVDEA
ncbi:hypothetical protein BHE74_00008560 [Ensete ventricosum]|nr:hypothetical protein BHE74_00008560 [Ensete ventricosum]